ncbi:phage Gp37/Gp68 family protein [Mesorhizobium sp. M0894]|uniref:DUF5131 family protein n=1 Tax=unclassified Mesorhizobium TaxID=325217 RepID=UPI00333636D3
MADHSSIEWTDATWNPITGCSIVSPGCTNCYAMKLAGTRLKHIDSRKGLTRDTKAGPVWTGEVRLNRQWLHQPLDWKKPRRIFVCAHGDLFAENVPDGWILDVFTVMAAADHHTYQVLTKRADRMREFLSRRDLLEDIYVNWFTFTGKPAEVYSWPLHNVWCGVSAEDQKRADERVPELLATPAAIRFVSAEPLLGPIRFDRIGEFTDTFEDCGGHPDPHWPANAQDATWLNAPAGKMQAEARDPSGNRLGDIDVGLPHDGGKLDWIIVGGESGPGARPMHPAWARSIRDQCAASGTAFFFKQWGEWAPQIGAVDGWTLDDNPEISRFEHREWEDGRWSEPFWPMWCDWQDGNYDEEQCVSRIGKKRAGRLLDGVEHNAMPGVSA